MMTRTLYESLPYSYITLGSSSMLLLEQSLALASSTILFWLGAKIYSLRSANRRTDKKRRRKSGIFPSFIYDLMPFAYLFAALILFKVSLASANIVMAIILMSYSFYILVRRAAYRHHRVDKRIII